MYEAWKVEQLTSIYLLSICRSHVDFRNNRLDRLLFWCWRWKRSCKWEWDRTWSQWYYRHLKYRTYIFSQITKWSLHWFPQSIVTVLLRNVLASISYQNHDLSVCSNVYILIILMGKFAIGYQSDKMFCVK